MRTLSVLACFLFSCTFAAPTTFPFENEAYVPPDLLPATPSYTFTDDDNGGYHWTHIWNLDLNTVDLPFCLMISNANMFPLVYTYNAPPILSIDSWNCTVLGIEFAASDFSGVVNGVSPQTMCDVGNCCKDMLGEYKFADDQDDWHNWIDNLAQIGLCGEVPVEELYCNFIAGHYQGNCFTRLTGQLTRTHTFPCIDVHTLYFLSCPVYQTVPVHFGYAPEPDKYLDQLTAEERIVVYNSVEEADHICKPYSYFFPDATKESTSGKESTQGEDDSGAIMHFFSIIVFVNI
jgi:hypothetical protein